MFPYRVKYTDAESDIQNNDLLYKINQTHQTTFVFVWENVGKQKTQTNQDFQKCILYYL